ncbi:MAG: Ig-like domain-containing protein [Longimicrobiales bacterium]
MRSKLGAVAAGLALLAACDADAVAPGALTVAVVEVAPESRTMLVGDTLRLIALARTDDGTLVEGRPIVWASLDETFAEVAGAGQTALVTARWPGSATIAATVDGKVGTTTLTVVEVAPVPASIEISPGFGWLDIGQAAQVQAVVRSADGGLLDPTGMTWATDDEEVASVAPLAISGQARVTARGEGATRITASLGGLSATMTMTILAASEPASGMDLSPAALTVERGTAVTLRAAVWALDGAWIQDPVVHWSSSDTAVATVTRGASGGRATLTARARGVVTVRAASGGHMDSARIAVVAPYDVGQVIVTSGDRSVWKGSLLTFDAKVLGPTGGTLIGAPVLWSVEDPTVAEMDAAGQIMALRAGTTRVVAESGGVRGTATLTVRVWPSDGVAELALKPGVDPAGGRRDVVSVGETTWTDSTGVAHPAWLWLEGGSLSLNGSRYTQRFHVAVMISGFGGIMRRVERRTVESSGVVGRNVFDPYGFLLFPEGGEPALEAAPWDAGSWVIEQEVGTAPALRWLWTMG